MASKMEPRGHDRTAGLARWGGPRRSQDRLGSVLFSSCRSGSLFWSSWAPLRVVFGRSGGRFGVFSAFQLIDSTHHLIDSSIQLINASTHQPMALRHFLTRPGGLRAARLNKKIHVLAMKTTKNSEANEIGKHVSKFFLLEQNKIRKMSTKKVSPLCSRISTLFSCFSIRFPTKTP